ncbi:MAG: TPM domain-containing protein [Burkholderiales bacterium]|nr:TPM domain-containing protein [Burkholderiales bacterium]
MPADRISRAYTAIVFVALLLAMFGARAQELQPVPALSAHVIDSTGTLDAIQIKGLDDKLAAFEKEKGSQVVFLVVATTQPEDIASYANRVGNAWKIGRKGIGDGLLLVVAKNDRKIRIEVAKTLEGAIPDLAAKRIIDSALTPNFRQNEYAGGLQAAADQIIALIKGEALPEPQAQSSSSHGVDGFNWMDLAIFLFIAVPVVGSVLGRILGHKLGALVTGGGVGVVALFITSSLAVASIAGVAALLFSLFSSFRPPAFSRGWSSGGGGWSSGGGSSGSSSSGGFSSGGGGDFGGGGASGDW